MNRPNDKQIEKVLAGIATAQEAIGVAEWFATEEGSAYLDGIMTQHAEKLNPETAELYVPHVIPSEKMYRQIQRNISQKRIKGIYFRVAAILIPVIFLIGIYMQLNSRVDLFGTTEYEELHVAKGERMQLIFQDGTRVYVNADSRLKYPKKFGLSKREVYLEGEAYFVVAKNKYRPFMVNLNGSTLEVTGTSFDVQAYPDSKNIIVYLDEGRVSLALPTEEKYPMNPGEKLVYNKKSNQCTISKMDDTSGMSMWKQNVIVFKDTPLSEVIRTLNRWYDVEFTFEKENMLNYLYTLTTDNTSLNKVLMDLEKIAPVKFDYYEDKKEVKVSMKSSRQ